jgi:hypothetical protein
MRRSHSFRSWQRRYERPGRASLGRGKETRDRSDENLLLKKEVRVSTDRATQTCSIWVV